MFTQYRIKQSNIVSLLGPLHISQNSSTDRGRRQHKRRPASLCTYIRAWQLQVSGHVETNTSTLPAIYSHTAAGWGHGPQSTGILRGPFVYLYLKFGVPQVSVLGPLLFILYKADLGKLMDSCGLLSHFCANDSQLYAAGRPSSCDEVRRRMKCGVEKIARWMESNCVRMNPSKTDFLWCATHRRCHQLSTDPILIDDASLTLASYSPWHRCYTAVWHVNEVTYQPDCWTMFSSIAVNQELH